MLGRLGLVCGWKGPGLSRRRSLEVFRSVEVGCLGLVHVAGTAVLLGVIDSALFQGDR